MTANYDWKEYVPANHRTPVDLIAQLARVKIVRLTQVAKGPRMATRQLKKRRVVERRKDMEKEKEKRYQKRKLQRVARQRKQVGVNAGLR